MINLQTVNRLPVIAALLCLLFLLASCGERTPQLRKLSSDSVIVAFGDSITYGTGAKDGESYPAQLELITGIQVINEGIPGELSAEGLQRLPGVLDEYQPALLILCHGGNDMLRKKNKTTIGENLQAMVAQAHQRDIQVVLIGVPEPALFLLSSSPFYEEVATSQKIPIDSVTLPEIESDKDLKSDTIHPNAAGYRKLAEALANLLKKAGAI